MTRGLSAVDWAALDKAGPGGGVWSMPGWHGLRWAMMRGDGAGTPVGAAGIAMVADALACVSVEVDIAERGTFVFDHYDDRRAVHLWGRWWSPAALDVLRRVSVSGMVGSYRPSDHQTFGVLVGLDAEREPAFLLLARDTPLGEVI